MDQLGIMSSHCLYDCLPVGGFNLVPSVYRPRLSSQSLLLLVPPTITPGHREIPPSLALWGQLSLVRSKKDIKFIGGHLLAHVYVLERPRRRHGLDS